jgi:NAD-dependent DNA ligase
MGGQTTMIDLSDIQNYKANEISNAKIEKLRAEQAATMEKLADAERKVEQGENKITLLTQSLSTMERKARTKRLIERGAIAESFFADAEKLTNDEFKRILATAF